MKTSNCITEEEEPKKFSFDWEVLLDATIKLNDFKEIAVFFSRVYVEYYIFLKNTFKINFFRDLDLLNLGEKYEKVKEESLVEKFEKLSIKTIYNQKFLINVINFK